MFRYPDQSYIKALTLTFLGILEPFSLKKITQEVKTFVLFNQKNPNWPTLIFSGDDTRTHLFYILAWAYWLCHYNYYWQNLQLFWGTIHHFNHHYLLTNTTQCIIRYKVRLFFLFFFAPGGRMKTWAVPAGRRVSIVVRMGVGITYVRQKTKLCSGIPTDPTLKPHS